MVKNHLVRKDSLCHHYMGYSFRLVARNLLYRQESIYTTAFVIPVMEHLLEQEIAQWFHHEGSIWCPIASWADALPQRYMSAKIV